jgi:UDP-glucose 4-epimerase
MLKHAFPSARPPRRVIVLGAGGFIGGAIERRIAADGIPAVGLGRAQLDLTKPNAAASLRGLLDSEDVLVFTSARAPCKDLAMLRENLSMAETVCAAVEAQPVAHVVYVSSDAVYRDAPHPLTETSCAEPSSLHGAMHLTREIALRNAYGGPLTIVRPTLVYGIDDPHNGYGPNRFRRLAATGKDIALFGAGEERRDHVYVEDVAELTRLVIVHRTSGILNAVSGEVVSFLELADFAASEFASPARITFIPRNGPMPHNGHRPFDHTAVRQAFPDFRFRSWREGLAAVHEQQRSQGRV